MLDEVERGLQQEPEAIHRELALHLMDRLNEVAEVVDRYAEVEGLSTSEEDINPQVSDQVQCPD